MGPNNVILERNRHFSKVLHLITNVFGFVTLSLTFGYMFNVPKKEQFYLEIYSKQDLSTIFYQLLLNFRIVWQPSNGFMQETQKIKFRIFQKVFFSQKVKLSTFSGHFNSLFFNYSKLGSNNPRTLKKLNYWMFQIFYTRII